MANGSLYSTPQSTVLFTAMSVVLRVPGNKYLLKEKITGPKKA